MSIGQNIKRLRKFNEMTQVELGQKLGRSESMIRKYESDTITPSVEMLNKISDLFNVSVSDIVVDTGQTYVIDKDTGENFTFNTPNLKEESSENEVNLKTVSITAEISNAINNYIAYIKPDENNRELSNKKVDELLKKISDLIEYETYKEKNK